MSAPTNVSCQSQVKKEGIPSTSGEGDTFTNRTQRQLQLGSKMDYIQLVPIVLQGHSIRFSAEIRDMLERAFEMTC